MAKLQMVDADSARGSVPCPRLPNKLPRVMRWLRWERSATKERRKLISHVTVLRGRAERLSNTVPDAESPANLRVRNLLNQKDWCKSSERGMHDHADQLEELLPYIADESYLRTALAYELTRTDEPIRLTKLLPEAQLSELRRLSSSRPPNSPGGPMAAKESGGWLSPSASWPENATRRSATTA